VSACAGRGGWLPKPPLCNISANSIAWFRVRVLLSCSTSFRSPLHSANCDYELLQYLSLSMSVNLQFSLQSCLSLTAYYSLADSSCWRIARLNTITSVNTTVLGFKVVLEHLAYLRVCVGPCPPFSLTVDV